MLFYVSAKLGYGLYKSERYHDAVVKLEEAEKGLSLEYADDPQKWERRYLFCLTFLVKSRIHMNQPDTASKTLNDLDGIVSALYQKDPAKWVYEQAETRLLLCKTAMLKGRKKDSLIHLAEASDILDIYYPKDPQMWAELHEERMKIENG